MSVLWHLGQLAGHARWGRQRCYSASVAVHHGGDSDSSSSTAARTVNLKWIRRDGSVINTKATVGKSLLNVAHKFGIELEGACEGVCACSTCHVILPQQVFDKLPEPAEEEEDMLDQAFGLTSTSRLGCQVIVEDAHEGIEIKIPKATRNFAVDGFVPKPH